MSRQAEHYLLKSQAVRPSDVLHREESDNAGRRVLSLSPVVASLLNVRRLCHSPQKRSLLSLMKASLVAQSRGTNPWVYESLGIVLLEQNISSDLARYVYMLAKIKGRNI